MDFHKLKNYINDDTLSDWFDIMYSNHKCYRIDNKNNFLLRIENKKKEYITKFLDHFDSDPNYVSDLDYDTIKEKIKNKEKFICYHPKLYNDKYKLYVIPDLIFHRDLFLKYFPDVKVDIPEYIIFDILYKIIYFNSEKNDILNKNNITYHKCKLYVSSDSLNIKNKGYFIAREYRHRENKLNKKESIGFFEFKREHKELVVNGLKWLQKLNENYDKWSVYPEPSIIELYPNMNYKQGRWQNEKRILAELIKEITLIWNISYKERCNLLHKGIKKWNDPLLLNNIYSYKVNEYRNFDVQNKMIHINLNDEIDIKPRKIKNYDFIQKIKDTSNSIILDIESIINEDINDDYFKDEYYTELPRIAIIGTINNNTNVFKDFTIKYISNEEEKKIINYWTNYLFNIFKDKKIKVYHWGNAEKSYIKYMKQKYNDINFPEFELIDLLYYFKKEPISIKGCFGYGLKEIVKCLYNLNLIDNQWQEDLDGLEAMIKIIEVSDKSKIMNIPLKRFKEIKNIIYYNYMDCRVLVDILQLLHSMI